MNSNIIICTLHILFIIFEVFAKADSFECPEKFGHFPDSADCSKYHVCNHGRSSMQQCDDGLFYNTGLKTCDWPRNVQCDRGGKRVNTRRNPDLKKNSYNRQNSEFEETNQLSPHTNSEELNTYDNPPNDHNIDNSDEYQPSDNYRQPALNGRPPVDKKPSVPPKWQRGFSPKQQFPSNTQSRGPIHKNPSPKATPIEEPPTIETKGGSFDDENDEYEIPDYYEYEEDAPVRVIRKPLKEAEPPKTNAVDAKQKPPSVRRIGWLPEDPDSDQVNDYHWSPNDAGDYSKDKPKIPSEAFVKMKDFRNVEKQLAEDDSPNEGPPPAEDEEYEDDYEDEEHPPNEDEDYHHHHEEEAPPEHEHDEPERIEHPPSERDGPPKAVQYDDDEEVRQQPRVQPPVVSRPHLRQRVPVPPKPSTIHRQPPPHSTQNTFSKPRVGQPFSRINPSVNQPDEISGLRSVANKYESVPKTITSAAKTSADHSTNPEINTNIHYRNSNSPYLRPILEDSPDNNNYIKGRLIKSVPRNDVSPKKRVVVRKVIKQNRKPQSLVEDSEPVTPSVYQLLDDYQREIPDALLKHKKKAQEFRDTIIDNYMNNDKPNYILNDRDFDRNTYTVPIVSGEGDDNLSDNIRDFDKDFNTAKNNKNNVENNDQNHKKLSSDRNSIHLTQNNYKNQTKDKPFKDKTDSNFMNTDAIVKHQRTQGFIDVSSLTTVSPPVRKVSKKPTIFESPPFNDYKPPPKRKPQTNPQTIPTRFGFKETSPTTTLPDNTTPRPEQLPTPKQTSKPRTIRIKTPRRTTPMPTVTTPKPIEKQVLISKMKKKPEWFKNVNYEPKPSNTDVAQTKAHKCDPNYCRLPDCRCGGIDIPGELHPKQTPQIVLLTFDDSVNDLNWDIYDELFNSGRNNPNGCPILATFYVSHEWTDYAQVQTLYSRGHEMASHSITHSFGEKFSKDLWLKEIAGQRELLSRYGGVKESDVRGMRAPFLQTGGNTMFEMLYEANFTYDSSLPIYEIRPPYYPYTLDYAINHECMIPPCPKKSFPGLWEVGMVMWEDLRNGRCSMADACFNPKDEQGVYEMVKKNFDRHYTTNRAPFGIYFHSRWFLTDINRKGFLKFMDEMNGLNDVYFVTNSQMIEWMRNPTPSNKIKSFKPWMCDYSDRPGECNQPNQCKAKFRSETRVLKTCQPCPKVYPWRGNNGLKST